MTALDIFTAVITLLCACTVAIWAIVAWFLATTLWVALKDAWKWWRQAHG